MTESMFEVAAIAEEVFLSLSNAWQIMSLSSLAPLGLHDGSHDNHSLLLQ